MAKRDDEKFENSATAADDNEYFKHFRSTYRFQGRPFEAFLSAYHYAEQRFDDERVQGKEWPEVEQEFQEDWERSHPGTWPRVREAIYYGWHRNNKR